MKDEMIGRKFNRLTVIRPDEPRGKRKRKAYLCRCECGKEVAVMAYNLKNGHSKSCGCWKAETSRMNGNKKKTHGKTGTRLHFTWLGMIQRCENPNVSQYPRYGGRGIKICREWREDFVAFEKWALSHGYQDDLTIDRIDNNGDYEPSNCRWATVEQQNNNRSNNVLITIDGETLSATQWAKRSGVHRQTIIRRMEKGYTGKTLISKRYIR